MLHRSHNQGDLCPGGSLSRGSLSKGVSVQGGLCPVGGLCPGGGSLLGRTPARTVTGGRYASYWNAFLLNVSLPVFFLHSMAADRTQRRLSSPQIVHLAAAIWADKMAAMAEGYLDIPSETINNLKYETKDSAETFNREIIRCWAYRNPENQVEVIIYCFILPNQVSLLK